MTRIRVDPANLRQSARQLSGIADRLRSLGSEAHQATLRAPSYDGQFGPRARAMGMEAEARLRAQADRLSALSEELESRAAAFEAVDQETLTAFDRLTQLLLGWIEQAKPILSPYVQIALFPWQKVEQHLRFGYLIDETVGENGEGEEEEEDEWSPPWWSPIAIGASDIWNWYDQFVNRNIYQSLGIQMPGFPANGPITHALTKLSGVDDSGNPISPVGNDLARLIEDRGGVVVWFSDTLTGGGDAGVAPMKGYVWLPESYADPTMQEQTDEVKLIAHELEHVLQRDLAEFPDGTPTLFPPSPPAGSWPWGPEGFNPFSLEYGAPLVGDFTLYMEVQSNIVEKAIHYDLLSVELEALPPGDPENLHPGIERQMNDLANSLATYTGDPADACAYVVQEYNAHGMYVGEMAKEAIFGARIPSGGWEHWLRQQGFSEEAIQHIADIASQGTPKEILLSGMLDSHADIGHTVPPSEIPTPSPIPTPTQVSTGTPDATSSGILDSTDSKTHYPSQTPTPMPPPEN